MSAIKQIDDNLWTYRGNTYTNREDIPTFGRETFEKGAKFATDVIQDLDEQEFTLGPLKGLPTPGNLAVDAAKLVGKGIQAVDQTRPKIPGTDVEITDIVPSPPHMAIDALEGVNKAFDVVSKYMETQSGLYRGWWKVGGELALDVATSGSARARMLNKVDNIVDATRVFDNFGGHTALAPVTGDLSMLKKTENAFTIAKNNLPQGSVFAAQTGYSKMRNLDEIQKAKASEQVKLDDFRKTPDAQNLLDGAYKHFEKHGNLKDYTKLDEFIIRKKNTVDVANQKGLSIASQNIRDLEAAKRAIKTEISKSSVQDLATKYNQPPEIVDLFLEQQSKGKRILEQRIVKINQNLKQRFKDNPEFAAAYKKKLKASLGHIQAADTFDEAADILSNLELENFFVNAKRAHKNELPPELSRALGASRNLEEEFLKFIDPQLGNYWSELKGPQKRRFKKLVLGGMDVDDALTKTGFGKFTLDGRKLTRTNSNVFPDQIQNHIKRSQEIGITEPTWKNGKIDYTWRPETNTGQIDIPEQTTFNKKGFKGLKDDFYSQIE